MRTVLEWPQSHAISKTINMLTNKSEPQQKCRLGTVSKILLGGLNRFYRRLTSPSASIMAQNIQLFGPRGGFLTHQWIINKTYRKEIGMLYNGILKHIPLSNFSSSKSGQVLITYSLGAAYDMTDLWYNRLVHLECNYIKD